MFISMSSSRLHTCWSFHSCFSPLRFNEAIETMTGPSAVFEASRRILTMSLQGPLTRGLLSVVTTEATHIAALLWNQVLYKWFHLIRYWLLSKKSLLFETFLHLLYFLRFEGCVYRRDLLAIAWLAELVRVYPILNGAHPSVWFFQPGWNMLALHSCFCPMCCAAAYINYILYIMYYAHICIFEIKIRPTKSYKYVCIIYSLCIIGPP